MERIIELRIELNYSITTCIKDGCDEKHADSKINNYNDERNMDK